MTDLTERLKGLSPAKRELVLRRLGGAAVTATTEKILPRATSGPARLSFSQERLWLLSQFAGASVAYNLTVGLRLSGELDRDALLGSLRGVVERHEVLRTVFVLEGSEPRQRVLADVALDLRDLDLSALSPDVRETELLRSATAAAAEPFDLERVPPLRAVLARLGPAEHALVVVVHHVAFDGWSAAVMVREIATLYAALAHGGAGALSPLPLQYADFAEWQRSRLEGPALEAAMSYWRTQLAGAPPALDLPTDFPRPATSSFRGDAYLHPLPRELASALETFARAEGATLFMVLLAALAALLARNSGQQDVVVGSPIANRVRSELEPLIGFFVNSLVLRTDLSGDPSFRTLLGRVRKTTLDAYAHQEAPFEKLVEMLRPPRALNQNPLFQVMLTLQNAPAEPLVLPGLTLRPFEIPQEGAKLDLLIDVRPSDAGLVMEWEYSADLFERASVARMARHYEALLRALVEAPDASVFAPSLLSPDERHELLVGWNDTATSYPPTFVHRAFEARAAAAPDAVAVDFEGTRTTYGALDARANQLAHRLRALGVGPESRVAVYLERSTELVVTLLAVLKAGGAYVPLDPSYPAERLAFMVEDAAPVVLVTAGTVADAMAGMAAHGPRMLRLDADAQAIAREPVTAPDVALTPGHAAYVIYTSGSTGRPKGVVNVHRGLANRLLWMQAQYPLDATDVVVQKTPYSFDVSVWEFFWPLLAGARIAVARPDGHRDPGYLAQLFRERGVTTAHFVPSMLQLFVEEPTAANCSSLRRVICSGEALPSALTKAFFERQPSAELHNLYGPTEASIDVTYWACRREDTSASVPIGAPIANTQVYVLDARMRPVPIGVPGELYLGGIGLARGYHRRPGLTADRFVPDPFAAQPGERLYRTGDRARWRADGVLDFLGRLDFQVKLRGLRIELDEITNALARQPAVREAAVLLREDGPTGPEIVAYVVAVDAEAFPLEEIKSALRRQLPDYMVPAAFVLLPSLPLGPSGKLERRALPPPPRSRATRAAEFVAARTETERALVRIWQEILHSDRIGLHDNFFDLGAHSITLARAHAAIRSAIKTDLTLQEMFSFTTVAALAARLDRGEETQSFDAEAKRAERQRDALRRFQKNRRGGNQ